MGNFYFPSNKQEIKEENKVVLEQFQPSDKTKIAPEEVFPNQDPVKGFTSIVLPCYFNSFPAFHYTGNCIGSIREHTDQQKTPYEIILVINGITGIKLDKLQESYCHKVTYNEKNEGFTKAMNKGIRLAIGEYVALVSNDVMVFDHWLEDMQEALQHLDYVMATPMYGMPFARAVEANLFRKQTLSKSIQDTFSDFADGACILTRKSLFAEIGLLNEDFANYKSDTDFRKRMGKLKKKYASTKRVNIHHIIGATTISMTREELKLDETDVAYKKLWGE